MNFKRIGIFLSGLLLIGGVSGCMKKSGEKEILNYLEEKYNEEFVIENYYKSSKLEYQFGADKIIVHPSNNQEVSFVAGEFDSPDGGYYDNYVLVKLANELKKDFEEDVSKNINDKFDFNIRIYAPDNIYDNTMINMEPIDFINKFKNEIDLGMKIAIEVDSEFKLDNSIEPIFNLYQKIKSFDTESNHISVGFVRDLNETEEYIRVSNSTNMTWSKFKKDIIIGELTINGKYDIQEMNDLRKYYISMGD